MNCLIRFLVMKLCIVGTGMTASAVAWDDNYLLDLLLHDTDRTYKIGYEDLVLSTHYVLEDIVGQMSIFKTQFSPIHNRLLADIHRLFAMISNEFYPFVQDYEYLYGYSLYEIAALRVVLLDLYDAMVIAPISSRLRYDYELEVIIEFLSGALHEILRPLLDLYSIRRLVDNLDRVRHVISTL